MERQRPRRVRQVLTATYGYVAADWGAERRQALAEAEGFGSVDELERWLESQGA